MGPMNIVVRPAEPDDGPSMGRIHVAAWRSAYSGIMPSDYLAGLEEERFGQRWTDWLSESVPSPADGAREDRPQHLVAELDGEVVAICTVGDLRDGVDGDPSGELWMLNADPDAFGSGAATMLHAGALSSLRAAGHDMAALWVADGNQRARRFYEREGWHDDGNLRIELVGGADVREVRYSRSLRS